MRKRRVDRRELFAEPGRAHQLRQGLDPAGIAHVRRRFERERTQHVGDRFEAALVFGQAIGIALRELRDFGLRAACAGRKVAPVRQRQEVVELAHDDPEAVRLEIEIADHFGLQQRNRVRRDRVAKARMELLGDRRAADDAAAFEHEHLEAGLREVRGADKAVVAGADQDRVVLV